MRCFCCDRPDASFADVPSGRTYCTSCKNDINDAIYNKFGKDDLNRIFKIDVNKEVSDLVQSKASSKERYRE
jgi:hypothetical protein